ncbi:LysM peptidoglycan-binding domain-containing protein [Megasphaera elsdenii]|uniref:LysM peptidoglycan-binding domain-containing protein n=1 Tax=Megasphaera elsdenii TaxID=907 RepID=UPI002430FCE7|nr:LysM domain-containing protein [Megasphaera elsdenii]
MKKTKVMMIMAAMLLGFGFYIGHPDEAVQAQNDAQIHIVQQGESLWDIARPIADERGEDIREVIFDLQVNNDLDENCNIRPGQRIIINF